MVTASYCERVVRMARKPPEELHLAYLGGPGGEKGGELVKMVKLKIKTSHLPVFVAVLFHFVVVFLYFFLLVVFSRC